MSNKWLSALVMGSISLALTTMLALLVVTQTPVVAPVLWASWLASVMLTGWVAWRTSSGRNAWGFLSFINGGISLAILFVNATLPASASAPYEPGGDWLRSVDLTPPVVARLREAMASGYFAIAVIVAGILFLAAAYLLLHRWDGSSRHAH